MAGLLALGGCGHFNPTLRTHGSVSRDSAGALVYANASPQVSLPLPPGWSLSAAAKNADADSVFLHSADGSCGIVLTTSYAVSSPEQAQGLTRAALEKLGAKVADRGSQQVGNLQALRIDAAFAKPAAEKPPALKAPAAVPGPEQATQAQPAPVAKPAAAKTYEEIYTMQSGPWMFTLITVRGPLCRQEFDSPLRGFRA